MLSLSILCRSSSFRRSLASLLALPSLHLCLVQQSLSLLLLLLDPPILNLVLLDQRLWRGAEDPLVLAEFTDPNISKGRRVVIVFVFGLLSALSSGNEVFLASPTTSFLCPRCLVGSLLLTIGRVLRGCQAALSRMGYWIGMTGWHAHVRAGLGCVGAHSSHCWTLMHCGGTGSRPGNCTRYL